MHGPCSEWGDDRASAYKTRLGLWMFLLYGIVYAGFVVVNSVWPHLMERTLGSLNIAAIYGFGLIILAFVLALVYNAACSRAEERLNESYTDDEQEEF